MLRNSAPETIKERHYKAGYVVKTQLILSQLENMPTGHKIEVQRAYTPSGDWIGASKQAHYLCKKRGIAPEKAKRSHSVCSIGFCQAEQKWYGWSHRAICGFGIGDKLFDEHWVFAKDDTPFIEHGSVTIETLDQARQAAVNFAAYVS